jgi:hypothetical protein
MGVVDQHAAYVLAIRPRRRDAISQDGIEPGLNMKSIAAALMMAILLAGCASQSELAAENQQYRQTEGRMQGIREHAFVSCDGAGACEKAWLLTKNYVEKTSDMKVRVSDDALIETFEPSKTGYLGFKATRMPQKAGMRITLEGSCKNMYYENGPGPGYDRCVLRLAPALTHYLGFVNGRM